MGDPFAEMRRWCAWALVHADGRARWQLDVYAKVGGLAMRRKDDAELMAVYTEIASDGPCNWNWYGHRREPLTVALLGREPAPGERVTDTLNAWVGRPAEEWPAVLPVPEEVPRA